MLMLEDFVYCTRQNKFYYKPTGIAWKSAGINALCEPIEENGKLIKPTDWIRKHARVETMPERASRSPLDC